MISRYGNPDASVHLIRMADSHDFRDIENEAGEIAKLAGTDFLLTAVGVEDWNRDLSPWKAPAVFGREGFGDGAAATLQAVLEQAAEAGKTCIIGRHTRQTCFPRWPRPRLRYGFPDSRNIWRSMKSASVLSISASGTGKKRRGILYWPQSAAGSAWRTKC